MAIFSLFIFGATGFEMILVFLLMHKEIILGNQMDCIVEGIQNEAQAKSEPYRELVRNTCGMFGVPPNYIELGHRSESFFVRIPMEFVGRNQENNTFQVNRENETFGGLPDYSSIRREEELHRKTLVVALAFLLLFQLLIIHKVIFVLELIHENFAFSFIFSKTNPILLSSSQTRSCLVCAISSVL